MKLTFLTIALTILTLTGCKHENEHEYAQRMAKEHRLKHDGFAFRMGYNNDVANNVIYQLCVDGVTYLAHGDTLAPQQDVNGKNIACKKDEDSNE